VNTFVSDFEKVICSIDGIERGRDSNSTTKIGSIWILFACYAEDVD